MGKIPNLTIMVGISGSGKTSAAQRLSNDLGNCILSSDELRKELLADENDQSNNTMAFDELHKRICKKLSEGVNIIVDATNLSLKSRKSIFEKVNALNIPHTTTAYIMPKPIEQCIMDNNSRSRIVPEEVIRKQASYFQMPFLEEGFDSIIIDETSYDQPQFGELVNRMAHFDQKTKWHIYGLLTHCTKSALEMIKKYPEYTVAACLHDIGKLFTQTEKEDGDCSYHRHENVGAYTLLSYTDFFLKAGLEPDQILKILFLVNYHMLPFGFTTEKARNKWKGILGEYNYDLLVEFNRCDRLASGTQLNKLNTHSLPKIGDNISFTIENSPIRHGRIVEILYSSLEKKNIFVVKVRGGAKYKRIYLNQIISPNDNA